MGLEQAFSNSCTYCLVRKDGISNMKNTHYTHPTTFNKMTFILYGVAWYLVSGHCYMRSFTVFELRYQTMGLKLLIFKSQYGSKLIRKLYALFSCWLHLSQPVHNIILTPNIFVTYQVQVTRANYFGSSNVREIEFPYSVYCHHHTSSKMD